MKTKLKGKRGNRTTFFQTVINSNTKSSTRSTRTCLLREFIYHSLNQRLFVSPPENPLLPSKTDPKSDPQLEQYFCVFSGTGQNQYSKQQHRLGHLATKNCCRRVVTRSGAQTDTTSENKLKKPKVKSSQDPHQKLLDTIVPRKPDGVKRRVGHNKLGATKSILTIQKRRTN